MPYKNIIIQPANNSPQNRQQTSQFYVGFSTQDPSSQTVTLYDFDVVKQDLMNYFNTRQGERVMNPSWGTIIWDKLYDPFTADVRSAIEEDIKNIISSDPRVNVTQVDITEAEYGLVLQITLTFVPTNQTDTLRLTFDKNAGLSTQ
jgi:phage baseplate assembly protein W